MSFMVNGAETLSSSDMCRPMLLHDISDLLPEACDASKISCKPFTSLPHPYQLPILKFRSADQNETHCRSIAISTK